MVPAGEIHWMVGWINGWMCPRNAASKSPRNHERAGVFYDILTGATPAACLIAPIYPGVCIPYIRLGGEVMYCVLLHVSGTAGKCW